MDGLIAQSSYSPASPRLRGDAFSFADQVRGDLPAVRRSPMLEKVDPLPGPKRQAPIDHRNCELDAGESGADMRWHVVRTFLLVPVAPGFLGGQPIKESLEIGADLARRILLNDEPGGRMPAKQGEKPCLHLA